MLEKEMERAVINCPELFIEEGLTFVRQQFVINGRRPDVLFSDVLSRHLLVEIQHGRLDEQHVQRHFYYYYDYRAKFPKTHPRLLFIANRIVPQHKEFLDDHGYEFREYPESDFERKAKECEIKHLDTEQLSAEIAETNSILKPETREIIHQIEMHEMTLCYKMLLLTEMAELADHDGRVPVKLLAERFKTFFARRVLEGKSEENPKRVQAGVLSGRSIGEWQKVIREQPVRYLTEEFVIDEINSVKWSSRIWSIWNEHLKEQIRVAAWDRLVRYFNKHVPGGF
jgi:Endonuclease NucS C-terminal domain